MADSVEQVVYSYLTSDSSFMADFTGVYWIESDTNTYPYIVYWLVDDNGNNILLNRVQQGEARIQFDLWDDSKIRGARLRTKIAEKVKDMNESLEGYYVVVTGITEQTIQRASATDPYHFVVDGIIRWYKE